MRKDLTNIAMSLTITLPTTAGRWLPSNNDINFSIVSDQAYRTDFQYVIDVRINGTSAIKLRKYPLSANTPILVNIKDIVMAFMETTWCNDIVTPTFRPAPDVASIVLSVDEYYSGQPQTTSITSAIYVWNASATFQDEKKGVEKFVRQFVKYSGVSGKPLGYHLANETFPVTTHPLTGITLQKDKALIYPLNQGLRRTISLMTFTEYGDLLSRLTGKYIVLLGCDATGLVIKKLVKATGASQVVGNKIVAFPVGFNEIAVNQWDNFYKMFNFMSDDFADCKYVIAYSAASYNANITTADTPTSRPIVIEYSQCPESFAVLYATREGGWNVIQCNHRMTEDTDIETNTMLLTNPTTWSNDSTLVRPVEVLGQGTLKLNSGWVQDAIVEDIKDMLVSPKIFIEHWKEGNLEYTPVTLVNASYTTEETRAVNLRNYEFTFAESFYKNTIKR